MGPPFSGKPLENFVNEDNPVCVMNSSAQFCKMSVDYFFEIPRIPSGNDFIVTMFIEGVPVADSKGPKKLLKHRVSEVGLQCLNQFCYTVLTSNQAINSGSALSRSAARQCRVIFFRFIYLSVKTVALVRFVQIFYR